MQKVDVVVMAGGRISDPALPCAGNDNYGSLVMLHEKPLIHWVLQALRNSASVDRIVVMGPRSIDDLQIDSLYDELIPEAPNEVDSLLAGMHVIPDSSRILTVTGNMPLLSCEAVDDFVHNSMEGDVVYAAVAKPDVMTRFPEREWTFLPMAEGALRASGTALFCPQTFLQHKDTLRKVFNARTDVSELVKICGFGIALKFAAGKLSLKDVQNRIREVLAVDARSYISRYPELVFDVEKASDLLISERNCSWPTS